MKNILVIADPVETEQFAFQKALDIAKVTVANIHVVIFCYEKLGIIDPESSVTESEVQDMIIQRTKQWWESHLQAQQLSIPIAYEVVWEKHIHQWVLKHCQQTAYDLIIKTGHRSESIFYTPTDWQLFRKSNVPFYCLDATQVNDRKVVLVALDLMSKSDEKQSLNQRLLEAAFQLSLQINRDLHCAYAIEIPTPLQKLQIFNLPLRIEEVKKQARQQAALLTKNYDMSVDKIHIDQGRPAQVLTNLIQELEVACCVVGTMGRTGIEGKLIGNTAEEVIHQVHTDLLVIAPT